jgi:2-oxoglutarate dehydrogenase E1 component
LATRRSICRLARLTEDDLRRLPASLLGGPGADRCANAFEAIGRLRRVYCSTTGYDYAAIFVPEEREWLRHAAEFGQFRPPADPIDAIELLERITQVEAFERFLHRTFPGKTRFSIEGSTCWCPILDEVIADAADAGTEHVLLGMAHRGRLNVLAHVLQKPYAQILAEFKDPVRKRTAYRIDLGWTGDVKYHGARGRARGGKRGGDLDGAQPEPPRVRQPGGGRHGAGGGHARVDRPGPPEFDEDRRCRS